MWVIFSLAAAICAALVVVLSKAGIQKLDSTFVFGIESICICIVTWSLILARGLQKQVVGIDRKIWLFILGAGVLTALSSLFSFHSLKIGHASRTSSFEKISLVLAALLSIIFLKEKFNWQLGVGILMMLGGVLFIALSDTAK
jgi:transporter family protein